MERGEKIICLSFALLLFIITSSSFTSAAVTHNCSSCANCTAEVGNASVGDTVQLNQSISNTFGANTCVDFGSKNNIVFTCQNYSNFILGNSSFSTRGVYLSGVMNNTVKNCNISQFGKGIFLDAGSTNNTIMNNIGTTDGGWGIALWSSSNNNTLISNTERGIVNSGIYVDSSSYNTFLNNMGGSNSSPGIYFNGYSATNNLLINNTGTSDSNPGIQLQQAMNNLLINNTGFSNSSYGFWLYNCSNTLISNNGTSNSSDGIVLSAQAPNNILISNIGTSLSFSRGIFLNSPNNLLINNTAISTGFGGYSGIYIQGDSNVLINNTGICNQGPGIQIFQSLNNTLISNTGLSNASFGIGISGGANNTLISNLGLSNLTGGLFLSATFNNTISNSILNNNVYGLYIQNSNWTTVINMTTRNNSYGISITGASYNNTIKNSFIQLNNFSAFLLNNSPTFPKNNYIYNNYFNNSVPLSNISTSSINFFNITKTAGTNIVGGNYLGGNYWAAPNGTGFSQVCTSITDGICDISYNFDGINYDYLPLTCAENWICGSWSVCASNTQTRICNDANYCQTYKYKPILSQYCSTGSGNETNNPQPQVTQSASWGVISPGSPAVVKVNNSKSGIVNISISTTVNVSSASLIMQQLSNLTSSNFKIGTRGVVYQAFSITVVNLNASNLATVIIGFRVNKTWVQQNTSSPNRIYLYRQPVGSTKWSRLLTTQTGADSDYYYYSAISPGFSTFLVYYDAGDCIPTAMQCTNNEVQYCADNSTWVVKNQCLFGCSDGNCAEQNIFPNAYYIAGVVLFLGVIIFVYLRIRKGKKEISS